MPKFTVKCIPPCLLVLVVCFCVPFASLGLQRKLAGGEVSLHNQKLALSSVIKELNDTKQTIDRFRYGLYHILRG